MVSLHTVWYNFIRVHKTLKMPPSIAAVVSPTFWSMDERVSLMDEVAPKPGKRGHCKKARGGNFKLRHYPQARVSAPDIRIK